MPRPNSLAKSCHEAGLRLNGTAAIFFKQFTEDTHKTKLSDHPPPLFSLDPPQDQKKGKVKVEEERASGETKLRRRKRNARSPKTLQTLTLESKVRAVDGAREHGEGGLERPLPPPRRRRPRPRRPLAPGLPAHHRRMAGNATAFRFYSGSCYLRNFVPICQ